MQLRRTAADHHPISASEALELAADERPFDYDFLGKRSTLASESLAQLGQNGLPSVYSLPVFWPRPEGSGFDYVLRFEKPTPLKGVNRGEPHPLLYVDTMTHLPVESIRNKERELLNQGSPSRASLAAYLRDYCKVVGTDEIMLPSDIDEGTVAEPETYTEHRKMIELHLQQEKDREINSNIEDEPTDGRTGIGLPDGEDLDPLPTDLRR